MGDPADARAGLIDLVRRSTNRVLGQERPFLVFSTGVEKAYVQFFADDSVLWVDVPGGSCEGRVDYMQAKLEILGSDVVVHVFDDDGEQHPCVDRRCADVDEALSLLDALLAVHGRPWVVNFTELTPDNQ